jgi:hypothetical protein
MRPASSQVDPAQLRRRVLDALDLLWLPARPVEELGPLLETAHQHPVDSEALRQLLDQERADFAAGRRRPVWLCLGIGPDLRGDPDRWARSDWPLWVRVVHPDPQSQRCENAWAVRELFSAQAMVGDSPKRVPPSPLTKLLISRARQLPRQAVERHRRWVRRSAQRSPGWVYDWQVDRFVVWEEAARDVFDTEAEEHRRRCEKVAAQLAGLDLATQLFGEAQRETARYVG